MMSNTVWIIDYIKGYIKGYIKVFQGSQSSIRMRARGTTTIWAQQYESRNILSS